MKKNVLCSKWFIMEKEKTFRIVNQNCYGPSKTCEEYMQFTIEVLGKGFPLLDSKQQKDYISFVLEKELPLEFDEIDILIQPPGHLNFHNPFSFGLFVFDKELSTIIKLMYS